MVWCCSGWSAGATIVHCRRFFANLWWKFDGKTAGGRRAAASMWCHYFRRGLSRLLCIVKSHSFIYLRNYTVYYDKLGAYNSSLCTIICQILSCRLFIHLAASFLGFSQLAYGPKSYQENHFRFLEQHFLQVVCHYWSWAKALKALTSLPAELRLSTLSTATFARRLKAHLFVIAEWRASSASDFTEGCTVYKYDYYYYYLNELHYYFKRLIIWYLFGHNMAIQLVKILCQQSEKVSLKVCRRWHAENSPS